MPLHPHLARLISRHRGSEAVLAPRVPASFEPLPAASAEPPELDLAIETPPRITPPQPLAAPPPSARPTATPTALPPIPPPVTLQPRVTPTPSAPRPPPPPPPPDLPAAPASAASQPVPRDMPERPAPIRRESATTSERPPPRTAAPPVTAPPPVTPVLPEPTPPPAATREPPPLASEPPAPTTTIHIAIGRVEVRAPAAVPARAELPQRATMSLAEYMRRQRGGPA